MPAVPSTVVHSVEPPQPSPAVKRLPLVRGNKLVCPNCGLARNPLNPKELKRLDRNPQYESELNVIYLCVKSRKAGCGHVFSPVDRNIVDIIKAYLAGELVHKSKINPEVKTDDSR
jgi:hypothetical protein